jgi:hypothetical protein
MTPELKAELARVGDQEDGGRLLEEFTKKLGRDGWLGLSWPKEYGGQEVTAMQYYIAFEEFGRVGLPNPNGTAIGMVGPTIIRVGSEEQKAEWLPKFTSGEVTVGLGYTEPGAGTDLANLQTRAVQDGDEYVISGQKMFATGNTSHMWLLARTDPEAPKHRGLSVFLVPLDSPGVVARPMQTMADFWVGETFYDNVRVPLKNLIGEKNRGWYHVAMALDFERVSIGGQYIKLKQRFDRLVGYVKNTPYNGGKVSDVPWVRDRMAWVAMGLEVSRLFSYRTAYLIGSGIVPNYEASAQKMFASEMIQHVADAATEVMGLHGLLKEADDRAPMDGEMERAYRDGIFLKFGGGSSEVMRDIIARRGLGLPR